MADPASQVYPRLETMRYSGFNMKAGFNFELLVELLTQSGAKLDAIPYKPFVAALAEFAKAFAYFGAALNFAFSDITAKAEIIVANFQDIGRFTDLQSMILDEISRGTERENSSEYISTARSVLRIMWFLDFLLKILELVWEDEKAHLATLVRHAYEIALAPHHNIALKTAARIAIRYVPDTSTFVAGMLGPGKTWSEYKEMLDRVISQVIPLRDTLWDFYRQHNLEDLP